MTQNNLYMEDDDLRLYIDVQPLFIDELESSKNAAQASALNAQQSESNAAEILVSMNSLKNTFESLYNQAISGLTSLLNESLAELNSLKNTITGNIQSAYNTILNSLDYHYNQLKMYLETLGSLYVNQAKEYANDAKNTVDNRVSADYLNNSKALETGSVSENNNILSWIKQLKYSTFDLSKFTTVGNPVISKDGILKSKSNNYIKTPVINFSDADTWSISIKFNMPSIYADQDIIAGNGGEYVGITAGTDGKIRFAIGNGSIWYITQIKGNVVPVGTICNYKLVFDGTNYTSYLNGELYATTALSSKTGNTEIFVGVARNGMLSSVTDTLIDVKSLSVVLDGTEVFNSSKSFVDTVKTSDFTAITTMYAFVYDTHTIYADSSSSPAKLYNADGSNYTGSDWTISEGSVCYGENTASYTSAGNKSSIINPPCPVVAGLNISEHGIASNFSENNYISYPSVQLGNYNNWEIVTRFKTGSASSYPNAQGIVNLSYNNYYGGLKINIKKDTNYLGVSLASSTSEEADIFNFTGNSSLSANTVYEISVKFTGFAYVGTLKNINNNTASLLFNTSSTTKVSTGLNTFKLGQRAAIEYMQGSIDLNCFKIYGNGDLVYQPCLKIPYYDCKTGSKIVDSIYRNRVCDMYEQFGYAPYYTLSDTDFSLPMGEIYGMIELLRKQITDIQSE